MWCYKDGQNNIRSERIRGTTLAAKIPKKVQEEGEMVRTWHEKG